MSTGYKINHAKDNAANYSIATNITTKIGAYMVAEDNVGEFTGNTRFGFVATSNDAINWEPAKDVIAYDHTIKFEDGSEFKASRRERPQFVFENSKPVCLFTAVYDGENAFNVAQTIELKEKTND